MLWVDEVDEKRGGGMQEGNGEYLLEVNKFINATWLHSNPQEKAEQLGVV